MRYLAIVTIAALAALLACTGCGSLSSYEAPPNTTLEHDPAIPLFAADTAAISDTDIARILDTRIELPTTFRVGLVHLDHERLQDGRRERDDRSHWPLVTEAFAPLQDHERVYDVAYLPRLVLPRPLTAGSLRAAAARYQADWVLIFETGTSVLTKNRIIGTDEARAYCTAECVVLDVRTGLIAFSSRSLVSLERDKKGGDWSLDEVVGLLEQEAVEEAMNENLVQLVRFLDRWRT